MSNTGTIERYNEAVKEHAFLKNLEPEQRSVIITMMIDSWLDGTIHGINTMSTHAVL